MARSFQVTFDAEDPARLAEFWMLALGYQIQPPPPEFASWDEWAFHMEIPETDWNNARALVDPEGTGPRLFIQKVPEGKSAKNRVHLDVAVDPAEGQSRMDAVEELVAALVAEGATYVRHVEEHGAEWVVCCDPEGNEFCVH